MQCNLDARGKRLRFLLGATVTLGAAVLLALKLVGVLASPAWWIAVAVMAPLGLFIVFEAWSGWCALRAMGIKTPL